MMQPVSEELLQSCDLERPISDPSCVDCDSFNDAYLAAAKAADEAGECDQARVYRLLGAITFFHFKPENKLEPFSNVIGYEDGSRTLVGSDFDREQLLALKKALSRIEALALRTRIADLIWTNLKSETDCARVAIDGYVQLVESLLDGTGKERFHEPDPTGVAAEDFLTRAAVIARATGWTKPENDGLRTTMAEVLRRSVQRGGMAVARIANMATDFGFQDVDTFLAELPEEVEKLLEQRDFFAAEAVQKLIIRRARLRKDEDAARSASLRLTEIYERKADATDSAMLKAHALQEAIDSLDGLKGVREERQRLHEKLKEAQLHMYEEFGSFSHEADLTDAVEQTLREFEGLDLLDSLARLARLALPSRPEKLLDDARTQMQRFPLQGLFPTQIIDRRGRTVARAGGGLDSEEAVRHKIIQTESIRIGISVAASIDPARRRIVESYRVNYSILHALASVSPFVPSGAEHAFARGMESFLYGDFFAATASLVPYLEAGLRAMVELAGRSSTAIVSGGIETSIGLGRLLGEHREALEAVFTPAIIYSIENLFEHDLGPKIRHSYCHGLSRDGAFYSHEYIYACWLIYALVILPLLQNWDAVKAHIQERVKSD